MSARELNDNCVLKYRPRVASKVLTQCQICTCLHCTCSGAREDVNEMIMGYKMIINNCANKLK